MIMRRNCTIAVVVGVFTCALAFFAGHAAGQANSTAGWTTLFDGKNLAAFNMIGDANWRLMDGAVQADKGNGFLVTKNSYADFQLKAEFWVNDEANSGVFLRCENPKQVT